MIAASTLALVAASALALPVVPAAVDDSPLELSVDGSTWSHAAPASLFADGLRLVPGDRTTATMHVRNAEETSGVLVVVVREPSGQSPAAERAFRLSGQDERGPGLAPTAVADLGVCTSVVSPQMLAPGESVAVDLGVQLDPGLSGEEVQNEAIDFDLWFGLTDATVAGVDEDGCPQFVQNNPGLDPAPPAALPTEDPDDAAAAPPVPGPGDFIPGPGGLAATGGTVALSAVIVGSALGGAGWLMLLLARRRRRRRA